jgi:signal transduction histidine kinase
LAAQGRSLRSILAAVTTVLVALALLVSGVLVALTSALERMTSSVASSVESVHLVEEAQIELLLHARIQDPTVRRHVEERIHRRLVAAHGFVTTRAEAELLAEAEARVAEYLEAARANDGSLATRQEAAYGALEAVVEANLADARASHALATRWNDRATLIGLAVATLVVLAAAGLLVWLKRRAFAPVFSLSSAMERFGKGDGEARAAEAGPSELREMSRRFNEMATALTRQRQAQFAFLGGVAHDLRNPLTVLKMSVAMLPPDRPLPPEPRVRQLVDRVGRQVTRLDRMAGDFLDLAKIEAGELELKVEVHDVRTLVSDVVDLFEGTAHEHRVVVSSPDHAILVPCDQLRIEQVLTNLVSNAIKYSPPGSTVEVAVEPSDAEVVLRVSDQGIGIAEGEREVVFEPFRRVGLSKESVPGVGLGLFVVKRIVYEHGGRVELDSTPGAGSTFRVHLPRFDAAALAEQVVH